MPAESKLPLILRCNLAKKCRREVVNAGVIDAMTVSITFLGAAGTVTGSKYLVTTDTTRILVDCGMFQGDRSWREKNWADPDIDLSTINAVLLTHAHIDHTGLLPRYFKKGMSCPIYATAPTSRLSKILLLDSARLQEEETEFRRETGRSRHNPPLPLYTEEDAKGVIELLTSVPVRSKYEIAPNIYATFTPMGHILGACSIVLEVEGKRIVFSGDIGRYDVPILLDPEPVHLGDILLIESTYGDRTHPKTSPAEELSKIINRTVERGGIVLIPSFAVGRTQTLLYYLRELKNTGSIPDIPVVVDSPMAHDATSVYLHHTSEYDVESMRLLRSGIQPFTVSGLRFASQRADSIKLNSVEQPMVLISASGMLTGGRVLHHLKQRLPDSKNTLLFVGFQPPGSRGAWLKSGASTCRMFGEEIPVRAEVTEISGLSAHGDKNELIRWCKSCSGTPGRVYVVHGESASANSFKETLKRELGWDTTVASYGEKITV
jgi:metallo-beta-lactamase family protein